MDDKLMYPIYAGYIFDAKHQTWRMAAVSLDGHRDVAISAFENVFPQHRRRDARLQAIVMARTLAEKYAPPSAVVTIRINARIPKDQPPTEEWQLFGMSQIAYVVQIPREANIALEFARNKVNQAKVRKLYAVLREQESGVWEIPFDDPLFDWLLESATS